jgi:hypothetical protein
MSSEKLTNIILIDSFKFEKNLYSLNLKFQFEDNPSKRVNIFVKEKESLKIFCFYKN